jgi:hypothetical protein
LNDKVWLDTDGHPPGRAAPGGKVRAPERRNTGNTRNTRELKLLRFLDDAI